jgi:two-component system response regulator
MERKVLLIDDNVDDVDLTLRAFRKNNFKNEIVIAYDGAEALEYLYTTDSEGSKINIPSLILLDIKLPKVDGLEVLKHIRNIEITKYIPIVMLTSSTEERDLITAYELGANSYIKKPIDFNSFVEVINCMGLYWLLFNELPGSFFKKSA